MQQKMKAALLGISHAQLPLDAALHEAAIISVNVISRPYIFHD